MFWKKKKHWYQLHQALWDELVPPDGQANTVQGELIRATGRLTAEATRNGNINWSDQFELMLNFVVATLNSEASFSELEKSEISAAGDHILENIEAPQFKDGVGYYLLSEYAVKYCLNNRTRQRREIDPLLRI